MPAHILPKSAVEPSVIAQVVINKYCDHAPLYRQNNIFARADVDLPEREHAVRYGWCRRRGSVASGGTVTQETPHPWRHTRRRNRDAYPGHEKRR
ncbi:hypothetical protein E1890_21515 [Salmonella enterica subsp. enterica serovar Mountpleasant]|nr:hypothetical protein [Salmonella enterica subsp. enterica serovar Mountpleasant]